MHLTAPPLPVGRRTRAPAPHAPSRTLGPCRRVAALVLAIGALYAGAAGFAAEPAPLRYPPDRAIDVTRLALELEVDVAKKEVSGVARVVARAQLVPLHVVELDALDLDIQAVTDASGEALAFDLTEAKLRVRLPAPLTEPGAAIDLRIRYRVRPENGLHFYGPSAVEPDVPQQLWSQNESLEARRWMPCVDHPEERQATEIAATVPEGFQVISNGRLVSRRPNGKGRVRWHYAQEFPHPAYLTTLVVGRFHVARDTWEGVPLTYYVPPARADDLERTFRHTKAMLSFFSKRFGVRYPYRKYDQVIVEQFNFGGMENTQATTLNERTLHDARADLDYSSDGLISHELAHQWFGDLVTCRDWAHIWLNEGFASFAEACWDERQNGRDAYLENMLGKAGAARHGGRSVPLVRRRYRSAGETFGGGTYPKGAWVLHMLRAELGEREFWRGIQRYLETYRGQPVETTDFRRAMEAVSHRSLGRFFDQWTERAGHPKLRVDVRWLGRDHLLEVSVKQTQPGEPFHLPIDVVLGLPGGEERTVVARLGQGPARLLLPLGARPRYVSIDPGLKVLREVVLKEPRDMLLAALEHAPSLVARVDAVLALRGDKSDAVRRGLERAVAQDTSSQVRIDAAASLQQLGGARSRDALLRALTVLAEGARETARTRAFTRRAVVDALANWREDETVARALTALVPTEPSYRVLAGIARALGGMHDPASFQVLKGLVALESHNDGVRNATLRALARRKELDGLDLLLRYAKAPTPWEVRDGAIRALGGFATRKELPDTRRDEVVDRLTEILREPSPRFRQAAIAALRAVGQSAQRTRAAVAALAATDPEASIRRAAKGALGALDKKTPKDAQVTALRKALEKATQAEAKLRERVERLEARLGEGEAAKRPW